ncbi:MAG: EamA family transporter RarD, partial [Firmicutes bacterium]|nr:EamA family transporter RarD [Bacillota bacterium]
SLIVIFPLILLAGNTNEIRSVFRDRRLLGFCFLAGILISVNWGSYIFAVSHGFVLDASLGYFIEPIVVSLIGVLFFKERMSKAEWITFGFAAVALVYMIFSLKTLPFLALVIAFSFALYGAVKKKLSLSANTSLFMETLCVSPFALLFIAYGEMAGLGCGGVFHGWQFLLLPLCGIVTAIPLLLFNIGVKKIPYYLSGILMYINPTLQFLIGLFLMGEDLVLHELIAFIVIWCGISFTIAEKMKLMKKAEE